MKFLKQFWNKFSKIIARVNNAILLAVFYFTVLGIYAILKRMIGIFQKASDKKSNWQPYLHQPKDLKDLERPF